MKTELPDQVPLIFVKHHEENNVFDRNLKTEET